MEENMAKVEIFHEIFFLKKSQYMSNNLFNPLQAGALFL